MLGCEERDKLYVLRFEENIDRRLPCQVASGVVGDESDTFAFEFFEPVSFEDIDSI